MLRDIYEQLENTMPTIEDTMVITDDTLDIEVVDIEDMLIDI